MIRCYPQSAVEGGEVTDGVLISICGPEDDPPVIPPTFGAVLRLEFNDVPFLRWTDQHGRRWLGPREEQVSQALAFGREYAGVPLAVHCLQGKSRSAAIALMLLADSFGAGREAETVARLLATSLQTISPNPAIVDMADTLLGRSGRLEAALHADCAEYRRWRAFWRDQGWTARTASGLDELTRVVTPARRE